MPSRYLLIEFDDEASAERLRAQIDNATLNGKRFRVVGLFAKPRAPFCSCPPQNQITTKTQESTLKRGKRLGWWMCTECKRPAQNNSALVNLLKPSDIIDMIRWDNWGHTWFNWIGSLGPSTLSTKIEDRMNQ
ncbi:hypothetical protein PBI_TRISCUIT_56 [Microbacterium phage Triscuit]|nr:hypothetical protein PBI_TRISCUIT_56 [Microbacterium phage Triscuit]